MKFALTAIGTGSTARPEPLREVVQKAEALGYESVWIPEHLAVPVNMTTPYPYSADGEFPGGAMVALHDPFVALSFIASCTERIKVGTAVFVLPLRNPIATAKAVASLDVLSNGRVLFGVGIGWLREEFEAVGMSFDDRAARTREAIRMMKQLWTDDLPEFKGRFHQFPPLGFNPKPVQKPHPPILLGGESDAALKRAATLGDGWIGVQHDPKSVAEKVRTLKRLVEAAGRDFSRFEITVGPKPGLKIDLDRVERFTAAGVHRLIVLAPGFAKRSRFESDLFPSMARFADQVIGKTS
jgi:probable F420-dependent oxidoreductase